MTDLAWLSRTELLIGKEKLNKLQQAHVLVVGLGGVGSFAAEFLCRAGVGRLTIVDGDVVEASNCNRQLPALTTTIGQSKADVMAERLLSINPKLDLVTVREFITPDGARRMLDQPYDYIVDAIDNISSKISFLQSAYWQDSPLISSMGAGGKFDPTLIQVVDIAKTYNCPFAQNVRKRLREVEIRKGIKTVFSPESPPEESLLLADGDTVKRSIYGTISYMPAAFGGVCASVVLRDLVE